MKISGYWGEIIKEEKTRIDSSGHIFTFQGREINKPDGKDNYLLLYIYHGKAKFFFKDKSTICSDGDFILYAPYEPQHHIYESNASGEFYYVHFTTDDERLLKLLEMKTSCPYHSVSSSFIADIFEEMITELQYKEKGYKTVCLSLLERLFINVNRQINNISNSVTSSEISAVIQYINKNYMINHSLDEYAKMCGLSKYHFLRQFKKFTLISPIKYRLLIRIRHAKERLINSCDSINKISEELGFSSSEHFSDIFKKQVGISPLFFRKSKRNK